MLIIHHKVQITILMVLVETLKVIQYETPVFGLDAKLQNLRISCQSP